MLSFPSFQDFRNGWLEEVLADNPSTTEVGHRFARKLITQWLDIPEDSDNIEYCDGAGDGGIDIAYLERGGESSGESLKGDTWYLVQSKYGAVSQGKLLDEAQKVLETLEGERPHLSSLADSLRERLLTFLGQASERDRLILVFATEKPVTSDGLRRTLETIRAIGRQRLGPLFDVEAVSIDTIYQRLAEGATASAVRVTVNSPLMSSSSGLLVGAISLFDLYEFLSDYRTQTAGDLDRLYEKNVRRFLGNRGRVNRAIKKTLEDAPEQFGLYNNGITIVVTDFQQSGNGTFVLFDPYIVNGCQTTRTIWDVCHTRMESGGTGRNAKLEDWRQRIKRGVVVVKIVKVGVGGEEAIKEITRYTNSQNAVREKDFLGLAENFKQWAEDMATKYGVFLEIQRGAWDSQYALQRQNPARRPQFKEHAYAFDLVKVYGAGWLKEPGTAFGNNAPFLPNGAIFRRIMNDENSGVSFGVEDLYAAYRLQLAADGYQFGRYAPVPTRRQTRFLYYMVVLELLRDVLIRASMNPSRDIMTQALINRDSRHFAELTI